MRLSPPSTLAFPATPSRSYSGENFEYVWVWFLPSELALELCSDNHMLSGCPGKPAGAKCFVSEQSKQLQYGKNQVSISFPRTYWRVCCVGSVQLRRERWRGDLRPGHHRPQVSGNSGEPGGQPCPTMNRLVGWLDCAGVWWTCCTQQTSCTDEAPACTEEDTETPYTLQSLLELESPKAMSQYQGHRNQKPFNLCPCSFDHSQGGGELQWVQAGDGDPRHLQKESHIIQKSNPFNHCGNHHTYCQGNLSNITRTNHFTRPFRPRPSIVGMSFPTLYRALQLVVMILFTLFIAGIAVAVILYVRQKSFARRTSKYK